MKQFEIFLLILGIIVWLIWTIGLPMYKCIKGKDVTELTWYDAIVFVILEIILILIIVIPSLSLSEEARDILNHESLLYALWENTCGVLQKEILELY